jgi:hypothetical protein
MSLFFTLTPKHTDAFFTPWRGFENYIAAQICLWKSQRLTNSRVIFLVILASATSWPRTVTFGFSESFPPLVPHSHSCCMCWADRCHLHVYVNCKTTIISLRPPRGIYGEQSHTGTGFSSSSSLFPCYYQSAYASYPYFILYHRRCIIWTIGSVVK